MTPAPFITLNHVTVRLRDRWLLRETNWRIRRGEQWVVWGANGAGESTLARTLMGQMPVVRGEVVRHYLEDPEVHAGRRPMALLDKPMEALSSGEMRKLLLARALLGDPCLLILDEPFNGLDRSAKDRLAQLLKRLVGAGT
jgi:molybdate transport system ATP-binding protein